MSKCTQDFRNTTYCALIFLFQCLFFRCTLENFHDTNLSRLAAVTMRSHMEGNNLVHSLRSNKYVVRMSKDAYEMLKRGLEVSVAT